MPDRVQVLESPLPTPLVAVVADAVPDPADQAVAADSILFYQVVNLNHEIYHFFLPTLFVLSPPL